MPNQNANPLTAPLSVIKSLGETMTQSVQQLTNGLTRTASQGLDALITGVPPVPGMPAAQRGAITPQSLLPGNFIQALGNIENVLIPPGLPKPTTMINGGKLVVPQPAGPQPAAPAAVSNGTAVTGRRVISEMRGY